MFRATSMVWATSPKPLTLQIIIIHQDAPCPQSLDLVSGWTRSHPDRSWDVQDNCLTTFAEHLALKMVIFPVKIIPIHQVWSWSQTRTSWQQSWSLTSWLLLFWPLTCSKFRLKLENSYLFMDGRTIPEIRRHIERMPCSINSHHALNIIKIYNRNG